MNYKKLIAEKGWKKNPKKCLKCTGTLTEVYENESRPNEKLEIMPNKGLFRYKINDSKVSGGSLNSLVHQHFMQ